MKKAIFLLLSLILVFSSGCYNYRDINRIFFSLSALMDVDDSKNITLYLENFKSYRGKEEKAGSEVRVVFTGTGITFFDAFSNIARKASHEINYSQIKALLFTENAAKHGLNNFIEPLDRNQKLTLRAYLFVYEGDPERYIHLVMKDEQFIGVFLDDLMTSQGHVSNIPSMRFYEYLNQKMLGSRVVLLPIIKNAHSNSRERLELTGAAVFKDDKMIDTLTTKELVPYQIGINHVKTGIITCPHPQNKDLNVSYQILHSKAKLSLKYDGKKVLYRKDINIKLSLTESTGPIDFTNKEVLEKMKSDVRNVIYNDCFQLFTRFKEKGIDIYNVQRLFNEKYPKIKLDNVIAITEGDPDSVINVQIDGGQDILNYN